MTVLRSALLEWDLTRAARIVTSGLAVFLALRVTNGFVAGIGATLLFLFVLTIPWEVADRLIDLSNDS